MTGVNHELPLDEQAFNVLTAAQQFVDERSRLTIKEAYRAPLGNNAELHLIANTDSKVDAANVQYAYVSADVDGRHTTIFSLNVHSILATGQVAGMVDGISFLLRTRAETPHGTLERGLLESMATCIVQRNERIPFASPVRTKLASRFYELLAQGDCLRIYSLQRRLPDNYLLGVNYSELDGSGKHLALIDAASPTMRLTLGRHGLRQQIVLEQARDGSLSSFHEPVDEGERAEAYGLPVSSVAIDPALGPAMGNAEYMQLYADSDRTHGRRELNPDMVTMLARQVTIAQRLA
ncbi:MAG: hypothetical protein JWM81_896 [Candidatus Saccharibacteria bacterium]|nr:hypothetical protein [Candidatus Saccharibacteria bacterium]